MRIALGFSELEEGILILSWKHREAQAVEDYMFISILMCLQGSFVVGDIVLWYCLSESKVARNGLGVLAYLMDASWIN